MLKTTKSKLLICIIPFIIIVLFATYYVYINIVENVMFQKVDLKIEASSVSQETQIEDMLLYFRRVAQELAITVGATYEKETIEDYDNILSEYTKREDSLLGMGILFNPNIKDGIGDYSGIYVDKHGERLELDSPLLVDKYRYFKENSLESFLENYKEYSDSTLSIRYNVGFDYVITSTCPIFNENGDCLGFVVADFSSDDLKEMVQGINDENISAFALDEKGTYIDAENNYLVVNYENIFNLNSETEEIDNNIISNETGLHIYTESGEKYYIYYNTIAGFDWKLVYIMPEYTISNKIERITDFYLVGSILITIFLSLIIIYIINKGIHKPIKLLLEEFEAVAKNNYIIDIPPELDKNDEFSAIATALREMKISLKEYQNKLEQKNQLLTESEKIVRESMEYNGAIIKAVPQLLFIMTRTGYCIDCKGSKIFAEMPKESYIGRHIRDLISEEDVGRISEILLNIKEGECIRDILVSSNMEDKMEYFMVNISYCRESEIVILINRVTELQNQLETNYFLSYNDQLTGLGNRRNFEETLEETITSHKFPCSVVVSDINGLKMVNDSFGHEKGDELLLKYAKSLKRLNLDKKCTSRIGGDEFSIILPYTEFEKTERMVNDLVSYCSGESVNGVTLSVSFGIATMYNEDESINEILKIAEDKMYQQKLYMYASRKDNTIEIINNTLHAKNKREQLHSKRVSELAEKTAKCLGMNQTQQNKLKTAGLMHDIGKIGIPEELLNKPSNLTEEEYREVSKHPEIGYRILKASGKMMEIADCVLSHHEKWDGTGYPRGIKGEEISLEARIISIADTYDAITNNREYRIGLPKEVAIAELIKFKGIQFDPNLVDVFVNEVLVDM